MDVNFGIIRKRCNYIYNKTYENNKTICNI